jgi:hypothetical protein
MIKNKRILALTGSFALLLGMMASAGAVAAGDGISWTGNGASGGVLTTSQCDEVNTPYLYWVFHPGGNASVSNVVLHLGGSGSGDFPMSASSEGGDAGAYKATTGYFTPDPATLQAWVTFDGSLGSGQPGLVISHGCAGTQESAPPSEGPSFSLDTGGETDSPSEPSTDGLGTSRTSSPADGAWLLVVALGVLLASIVVLTPARAKSRR